jgi:hypothetical protein
MACLGFTTGSSPGGHNGALNPQGMPRPVDRAFRHVDERSVASIAGPKIQSVSFDVDGGTLLANLGSDAAETVATSLQTRFGRGAEIAGGRIPGHSIEDAAGRDGTAFRS